MAPVSRLDQKLNLDGLGTLTLGQALSANNSGTNSPIDGPAGSGLRHPLGNGGTTAQAGPGRAGAGSPSKEYGSRLFPKRAREIQQQEGLAPQIWGPPTSGSGHSTPLRETIPESPGSDSFPDFDANTQTTASPSATNSVRRARAGTVPSRFPPVGTSQSLLSRSGRGTPTSSPYGTSTPVEGSTSSAAASNAALLSRLRAGSMPQRSGLPGGANPFGSSLFASNWLAGRDRASTLQSVRSSDAPSSPRDLSSDNDVRTLDYLGLVDTPQSPLAMDLLRGQQIKAPTIADLAALNAFNNKNMANRFRSYSVNAKEKYADGEDDDSEQLQALYAGQLTPSTEVTAATAAAIHEAVRQHNLEVQAFANFASANRPRARTAGVLDSPSSRVLRNYLPTPSRLDNSITAADLQSNDGSEYNALGVAMQAMQLNSVMPLDVGLDGNLEAPTRSLWLGSIPSSTTSHSLSAIFGQFGTIESARVLTHKGCGFVNFDSVASAMTAKVQCNGKELFPGCGPVRIGYAKEQSASNTPGINGAYSSPSPDPFVSQDRIDGGAAVGAASSASGGPAQTSGNINAETAAAALVTPNLIERRDEILSVVQQLGAGPDDQVRISADLDAAMAYNGYAAEIPAVPEPSHHRTFDAPRLREIRKRIDNSSCSQLEIENIAMDMLPEIAELSSDYLGNTVVQKLFEHCSEETKEAMLGEIAPHLAEIGIHKNGTWAAQKIMDVARTEKQMQMIVDALTPHAVNLFLDQYGNYVMQCCLRFPAPLNSFIFETMLNRLWAVGQGRFGARAMRACLESHFATNEQKRLMAAAIALHSVQLATNSNGALLLTWFLDTCTFPRRRSVLAPRLVPHLVHLCTHKVAYLTVLKIINQKNEPDARDTILRALFFDEATLGDIISDQACGATLIFKVLTTPFFDDTMRPECIEKVRDTLVRLKVPPTQGYKRLMDEVGLSSRQGGGTPGHGSRSASTTRQANGHPMDQNGYARAGAQAYATQLDPSIGLQRSISMDSTNFDPYNAAAAAGGLVTPQYTHSPALSAVGLPGQLTPQHLQYQQALLAQAQAQAQAQSQMPRPPLPQVSGSGYQYSPVAALSSGLPYAVTGSPAQLVDPFRSGPSSLHHHPPGIGAGYTGQQQQQPLYHQAPAGGPGSMFAAPGMNGFPAAYGGQSFYSPQVHHAQQYGQFPQPNLQHGGSPQFGGYGSAPGQGYPAGAGQSGGRRGRQQR